MHRPDAPEQNREPMPDDEIARVNAALRAGAIDYQIEPGGTFDPTAFTDAAMKRWPKVMARLHETERAGCSKQSSKPD